MVSARAAALRPSLIRQMNQRRKPSTVNLTMGQPVLPPDETVLDAAYARLRSEGHGYTENAGLIALRSAVAQYHGFPGRQGPEHVVMSAGSEQGVYLALTSCVNPGDEVLVPEPGYPAYAGIVRLLGAVPVFYPLSPETGLCARVEALQACLTPRTRAIVLNDPSNPFGSILPSEALDQIADFVETHHLVAVCDEIYRELRYDGRPHDSVANRTRRAVVVGGLSKSCALTGHRLGYVIADELVAQSMVLVNQLMITCAPRPAQYVGLEIFSRPELLKAHLPYYEAARAALCRAGAGLPQLNPIHVGDGGFYAVIDVRHQAQGDSLALAMQLLDEQDVAVVPGVAFGPSGDWFWRLSFAGGTQPVVEGMARISRFLSQRA